MEEDSISALAECCANVIILLLVYEVDLSSWILFDSQIFIKLKWLLGFVLTSLPAV